VMTMSLQVLHTDIYFRGFMNFNVDIISTQFFIEQSKKDNNQ